jgi:hypothetical protein
MFELFPLDPHDVLIVFQLLTLQAACDLDAVFILQV